VARARYRVSLSSHGKVEGPSSAAVAAEIEVVAVLMETHIQALLLSGLAEIQEMECTQTQMNDILVVALVGSGNFQSAQSCAAAFVEKNTDGLIVDVADLHRGWSLTHSVCHF
jgi:hypothetical protein